MNRDSRLARPGGNFDLQTEDMWGQNSMGPPASGEGLRKIHRLMRGRYVWAIALGLIGATVGTIVGVKSQEPGFESRGLIEIKAVVLDPFGADKPLQGWLPYVKSQVAMIQSQRTIQAAMDRVEWKAMNRPSSGEAMAEFASQLEVDYIPGSQLIEVAYTSTDPKVAAVAANCVMDAYYETYGDAGGKDIKRKIEFHNEQRGTLAQQVYGRREALLRLTEQYGTDDLAEFHNTMLVEQVRLEATLNTARVEREMIDAVIKQRNADGGAVSQLTPVQIAMNDKMMQDYLREQAAAQAQVDQLTRRKIGEKHPDMMSAQAYLAESTQRVEAYLKQVKENSLGVTVINGNTVLINADTINRSKQQEMSLEKALTDHKAKTASIGQQRVRLQTVKMEIDQIKEKLDEHNEQIANLSAQLKMSEGQVHILSHAEQAVLPTVDKRIQLGAMGFIGGGALPILLLMLIGLLDSRYRYSDDAGSTMSGIPLLGILPNLPDQLGDPEQASVAAHCVHQIRTMLQINGSNDDRRVFAITSASPGDGKTSLTLALGLSFAASGSRTLLIDCDLVGAGLTSRLNMTSPQGILEAMANQSLLDFVRTTDIANLSVLPVGGAHAHHAGSISPSAVRRLVNEARKHFDTILIDTGPILGSIEASPVAAAADGVILAVARGQQRSLVERSLGHLLSVGARLAGVVFNRAQAKDFERSFSRFASMRSLAHAHQNGNGNGRKDLPHEQGPTRYGPVARAVASSFKPSNADDRL